MGLRILVDPDCGRAVIYNSTYELALPPVIMSIGDHDAGEVAEMFLAYLQTAIDAGVAPLDVTQVSDLARRIYPDFIRQLQGEGRARREPVGG